MGMYYERELYNCINHLKILKEFFVSPLKKGKKYVSFSFSLHNSQTQKKKKKKNGFVRVREKEERKNGRQEER